MLDIRRHAPTKKPPITPRTSHSAKVRGRFLFITAITATKNQAKLNHDHRKTLSVRAEIILVWLTIAIGPG